MKNVFLTILGLGFLVLSCTKKEGVIEKNSSDTITTDTLSSKMPAVSNDTMQVSQDSSSNHIDSAGSAKK